MSSSTDLTHDVHRMETLRQAQAYNLRLGGGTAHLDNEGNAGGNAGEEDILSLAQADDINPHAYEDQLVWNDSSALCWLEIPVLALEEPVYHGTSEGVLAQGVGHLDWSSLPVGCTSSHCVLAAHSGMEEARMFDDLDTLKPGDVIVLHTLGDAYAYRVTGSEVVLPQEAERACEIREGRDLCTLMTCTPYGINTHRLLVHAERVPYEAQATPRIAATITHVGRRARPLAATTIVASFCSALSCVARIRHRRTLAHKTLPHAYTGWRHRTTATAGRRTSP